MGALTLRPIPKKGKARPDLASGRWSLTTPGRVRWACGWGRGGERLEAQAREEQRVRELERQLFHAERLGSMGRLAAGLAHELNNPLEGMANYLALAREHLGVQDLAAAGQDLEWVREGLDR